MKRVAIAALTLLLMGTMAVSGQAQTFGADVGTIYLSSDTSAYGGFQNATAGSFTPFEFYVVAELDYADIGAGEQNLSNGISGWEMGVSIPADIIITQAVTNPANALNLGSNVNWLVGLGTTFTASTSPILLATYTGLITNPVTPENLILRVGGADPSTFTPAVPGFLDGEVSGECFLPDLTPAKCKRKFAEAKGMTVNCVNKCMDINGIATDAPSWSRVKANFGG